MRRTKRPRRAPGRMSAMRDCGGSGVKAERRLTLPLLFSGACLSSSPAWPIGFSLPMISTDAQGEQDLTGLVMLILLLFATFTAVLHLLGMDHETDSGQMKRREQSWRRKLGLPNALVARTLVRGRA